MAQTLCFPLTEGVGYSLHTLLLPGREPLFRQKVEMIRGLTSFVSHLSAVTVSPHLIPVSCKLFILGGRVNLVPVTPSSLDADITHLFKR